VGVLLRYHSTFHEMLRASQSCERPLGRVLTETELRNLTDELPDQNRKTVQKKKEDMTSMFNLMKIQP